MHDFWDTAFSRAACLRCTRKYARLLAALQAPSDADRAAGLRRVARHWPSALREAQLTPEARLRERHDITLAERARAGVPRARWAAWGFADVPLWYELHHMTADVLRFRRRTGPRTPEHFLEALSEAGRHRWPSDSPLAEMLHARGFATRAVYDCLGWRAGLERRALVTLLFARTDLPERLLEGGTMRRA